jgi:hypothetical protein
MESSGVRPLFSYTIYPLPIALRAYSIIHPSDSFINNPPWLPITIVSTGNDDCLLLELGSTRFNSRVSSGTLRGDR